MAGFFVGFARWITGPADTDSRHTGPELREFRSLEGYLQESPQRIDRWPKADLIKLRSRLTREPESALSYPSLGATVNRLIAADDSSSPPPAAV